MITDLAALQQHLPELAGPGVAQAWLPRVIGAWLRRYADDGAPRAQKAMRLPRRQLSFSKGRGP